RRDEDRQEAKKDDVLGLHQTDPERPGDEERQRERERSLPGSECADHPGSALASASWPSFIVADEVCLAAPDGKRPVLPETAAGPVLAERKGSTGAWGARTRRGRRRGPRTSPASAD